MVKGGGQLDTRELLALLESPLEGITSAERVRGAIDAGLRWPTPYWPELAVKWLEEGVAFDADIAKLLDNVAGTSQFPQRLRHRAFALARKFEKSGSGG